MRRRRTAFLTMSFDAMGDDVLSCTLSFCDLSALHAWCLVSRRTSEVALGHGAWARLAARLGGPARLLTQSSAVPAKIAGAATGTEAVGAAASAAGEPEPAAPASAAAPVLGALSTTSHACLVASRLATTWPTELDTAVFPANRRNRCLALPARDGGGGDGGPVLRAAYTGREVGGDRCVRGDRPFPAANEAPFGLVLLKPGPQQQQHGGHCGFGGGNEPVLLLSNTCYFEVTIDGDDTAARSGAAQRVTGAEDDMFAIGLARASFPLQGRQPGWDRRSFGYHGDDGQLFHGHGESGRDLGCVPSRRTPGTWPCSC